MEKEEFISRVLGTPVAPYSRSILLPVAPEHCNGEVLMAAAIRTLLYSEPDELEKTVGRHGVDELHEQFPDHNETWEYIFREDVLRSPGSRQSI